MHGVVAAAAAGGGVIVVVAAAAWFDVEHANHRGEFHWSLVEGEPALDGAPADLDDQGRYLFHSCMLYSV